LLNCGYLDSANMDLNFVWLSWSAERRLSLHAGNYASKGLRLQASLLSKPGSFDQALALRQVDALTQLLLLLHLHNRVWLTLAFDTAREFVQQSSGKQGRERILAANGFRTCRRRGRTNL